MWWIYISETFLYLCFSILMGAFIIHLIPDNMRPAIKIKKRWLQLSVLGIVIFSLMPVIQVVLILKEFGGGFLITLFDVLAGFEVGKAWTITLIISIFFYLFVSIFPVLKNRLYILISILFTFVLILPMGWASHVGTQTSDWSGFIFQSLHFLPSIVWVGLLLIVSWFSVNHKNWLSFLKWFTPTAISCIAIIITTGVYMITITIDLKDYANAWTLSFGQSLLVKHLLIIPIILFAFINGIWIRRKLQRNENINPRPWVKAESIYLLLVFSATAALGQQPPPHAFEATLKSNGVSPLFSFFTGLTTQFPIPVQFGINIMNISLFLLSCIFLVLALLSFAKKAPAIIAFFLCFFFVISMYMALMTSVF